MEEMLQFLEAAKDDRYYVAFHLACFTGMRQGEILGLRWQDVDFENKRLYVRQALISTKGQGYILADVKTESSRRAIAVSEETIELLQSHRAKQAQERLRKGPEWQDFDLVVATQNGTPVSPRNLMRSFYRIMERANVPRIRFHDIRHTHATHLLQLGNDLKITSARLGHSSINITADLYSHVTADMQEVAVSLLEEAVKKKRKTP